ncbi:histidine kinase [Fodinicola feengrottensis]|uniref:histidine kinase n=1 Tax=Fodinicola feengrottensis TaxID=435914 RepID=A0ABP4V611_9ACTN
MTLLAGRWLGDEAGPVPRWRRGSRLLTRYVVLAVWAYASLREVYFFDSAVPKWLGYLLVVSGIAAAVAMGMALSRSVPWAIVAASVLVATSDVLFVVNPGSAGWIVSLVVCPMVLMRVPPRLGFRFVAVAALAIAVVEFVHIAQGTTGWGSLLGAAGGVFGTSSFGWSLRLMRERITTAEKLLEQEKETRDATARAQVLDERSRLAREIHDILAHTLSAQTVQLEGVRLMLKRRADPDEVLTHVDKAQRLARDGLAETRRALASLRGDVRPLPEALQLLAADASAKLSIEEPVPRLSPEVSVAVTRTVQEALTNTRKHAPGANVSISVRFPAGYCEVEVTDSGARTTAPAALAESGSGYGLAGMAERAELLGGHVEAGPAPIGADGKGFRVWLRIPV